MAALGDSTKYPYSSTSMNRSLEEVAFYANTNDLLIARIKLGQIRGMSPVLVEEIQRKFFTTVPVRVCVYQLREHIDQHFREEFVRALPDHEHGMGAAPLILYIANQVNLFAQIYLDQKSKDHNSYKRFLIEYYAATSDYLKTGRTDGIIKTGERFFSKICHQPLDERAIMPGFPREVAGKLDLETRLSNFRLILQALPTSQLLRPTWTLRCKQEPPIEMLTLASYYCLKNLCLAFYHFFEQCLEESDLKLITSTLDDFADLNNVEIDQAKLVPSFAALLKRKIPELNYFTGFQLLSFFEICTKFRKRFLLVYEPIVKDKSFNDFLYKQCSREQAEAYLTENEFWLDDFYQQVKEFQQQINDLASHLAVELQSLLNLHQLIHSTDLVALQSEVISFEDLLKILPDKIKRLSPADNQRFFSKSQKDPKGSAYRKSIKHFKQTITEIQTTLNNICELHLLNHDHFVRFRSPKHLVAVWSSMTWEEIQPLTMYRSIKWPNKKIEDISSIAKHFGSSPHKFARFDFTLPLTYSDLPTLRIIKLACGFTVVDEYINHLEKLGPAAQTGITFAVAHEPEGEMKRSAENLLCDESESKYEVADAASSQVEDTLTIQPPLTHLQTMLFEMMNQAMTKFGTGVEKAVQHTQDHLQHLFALANCFEQQLPFATSIRPQTFHTIVSITAAANLTIEQVYSAIDAKAHPVKTKTELSKTHNLKTLMDRNAEASNCLTADEYQMLLDTNFSEFDTRDIALFSKEGAARTRSQRHLASIYQWQFSDLPVDTLLTTVHSRITLSFRIVAKLINYFLTKEKKWEKAKTLIEWSQQWKTTLVENAKQKKVMLPYSPTPFQRKANEYIESIEKLINNLRAPELELNYRPQFDNLIHNKLSRLKSEIEKQATLNPEEIPGHLFHVFTLTNLIAFNVLNIYSIYLENLGKPVPNILPKELNKLVAILHSDPLPIHLKNFVSAPIRTTHHSIKREPMVKQQKQLAK